MAVVKRKASKSVLVKRKMAAKKRMALKKRRARNAAIKKKNMAVRARKARKALVMKKKRSEKVLRVAAARLLKADKAMRAKKAKKFVSKLNANAKPYIPMAKRVHRVPVAPAMGLVMGAKRAAAAAPPSLAMIMRKNAPKKALGQFALAKAALAQRGIAGGRRRRRKSSKKGKKRVGRPCKPCKK